LAALATSNSSFSTSRGRIAVCAGRKKHEIALSAAPGENALFVNFPDRLELRQAPYPLGFWGLVLAPVVQDLRDYALVERGQSAVDRSAASFVTGARERGVWPYRVDMRGSDAGPAALFEDARWAGAVYLSDYLTGSGLRLRKVGFVRPAQASASVASRLADSVELVEAGSTNGAGLQLRLVWRCLKPLGPDDAIMVHFWRDQTFVGDADGDSLGGLIPLWVWQPGTEIVDLRQVDLLGFEPGRYRVGVGLYNRASGLHFPVALGQAALAGPEEVLVGEFSVP
jgi:hypothetical protein